MSVRHLIDQYRFDSAVAALKEQGLEIPSAVVTFGFYKQRDSRTGTHVVTLLDGAQVLCINLGAGAKGKGEFIPSVVAHDNAGFMDYTG